MFKCCDCNTIWHEDVIDHSNYYETEKYRSSLEGTTDIKDFYKLHDRENEDKFRYIGMENLRNKKNCRYRLWRWSLFRLFIFSSR